MARSAASRGEGRSMHEDGRWPIADHAPGDCLSLEREPLRQRPMRSHRTHSRSENWWVSARMNARRGCLFHVIGVRVHAIVTERKKALGTGMISTNVPSQLID